MTRGKDFDVKERLLYILNDLEGQPVVSATYPANALSYDEEMQQIREFVEVAGEYGLAYESLVAAIECHPYVLSGRAAISLLELGLFLGYKTERDEDKVYERRYP
jgi:hypothetical protein